MQIYHPQVSKLHYICIYVALRNSCVNDDNAFSHYLGERAQWIISNQLKFVSAEVLRLIKLIEFNDRVNKVQVFS